MAVQAVRQVRARHAPLSRVLAGVGGASNGSASPGSPVVLVIGSGLAGLTAAIEARRTPGVSVIVLEKERKLGGNSAKASSGLSALTKASGDTPDAFIADTLRSGAGLSDERLVRKLVEDSEGALAFIQQLGVDMSKLAQLGAHSHARTYRPSSGPNVGVAIMSALSAAVDADEGIRVVANASADELLTAPAVAEGAGGRANDVDDRRVVGVVWSSPSEPRSELPAHAVVLATGGFAGSVERLTEWAPELASLPTTNGAFATGDGVCMAQRVGAEAVDLSQVQVHPTALVDPADPHTRTKFLAPEALRGSGGVLLDNSGRRFVNELATRAVVTAAIRERSGGRAHLVLSPAAAALFGLPTLAFYVTKGLATRFDDLPGLCAHLGVDERVLREEAAKHDAAARTGGPDELGKVVFPAGMLTPAPAPAGAGGSGSSSGAEGGFFVMQVTPALHYCMGGVRIGGDGAVISARTGRPIRGLFAAGEVTGGVHGRNRLAGNSLLECVVFGRAAGQNAAALALAVASSQPVGDTARLSSDSKL